MKNVIVTGASGFIGANLVCRLIREGCRVHLLMRPRYRRWRLTEVLAGTVVHEVDLRDKKQVSRLVARIRPRDVFNLAAHGAYSFQTDLAEMLDTNVLAAFHLMEAAADARVRSFVQVGSSSEYGFKDHAPGEREAVEPNSHYAVTKVCATMLARYVATSRQAPVVVLRPYTVFGPFEEPARFIPTLIVSGLAGRLPPLVSPTIVRDYVYVDDFVEACLVAARHASVCQGQIYNVGSGVQTTIREAVALARKMFAVKEKPVWASMPARSWDTDVWCSNSRKIRRELGWRPRVSFEQGFDKTVQWLLDHPRLLRYYRARAGAGRGPRTS